MPYLRASRWCACAAAVGLLALPGAAALWPLPWPLPGRASPARAARAAAPDIVVVGIGDSGTRGVRLALEALGVRMCSEASGDLDNTFTMPSQDYIRELLEAAQGRVSHAAGYRQSASYSAAVQAELEGARLTKECVDRDHADDIEGSTRWGYKNPRHLYLLPVMDDAFQRREHILIVARDPRDLCTGENQGQFAGLGSLVLGASQDNTSDVSTTSPRDCYLFWARVWQSTLNDYGHDERVRVVRIEDLVAPALEPESDVAAWVALDCVAEHAGLEPKRPASLRQLRALHRHASSYMGHHNGMTQAQRHVVELEVASYEGVVHDVMRDIGYRIDAYGLTAPASSRVCAAAG